MNAQLIFEKEQKFSIDDNPKNGCLIAHVKAVRADNYVVVDKTYSLDDWLTEPERSWRKPPQDIDTERVADDYAAAVFAVGRADFWFDVCKSYTDKDLTPLFLESLEKETAQAEQPNTD